MGFCLTIYQTTNYCPHCQRKDNKELLYVDSRMFVGDPTPFYGSLQFKSFTSKFQECEHRIYKSNEALTNMRAIKAIIKPSFYKKIISSLKKEGAYMWVSF